MLPDLLFRMLHAIARPESEYSRQRLAAVEDELRAFGDNVQTRLAALKAEGGCPFGAAAFGE